MAPMESKGILGWIFGRRGKDPLWDGFINRPLADGANDLPAAIRSAPEGADLSLEDRCAGSCWHVGQHEGFGLLARR